jgi:hypothetical protein
MSDQALHRYWLRFDPTRPIPVGFQMGCGITAFSQDDAMRLLRKVYPERFEIRVSEVVTDVALSDLESRHVIPNIGDHTQRGVWFPNFGPEGSSPAE